MIRMKRYPILLTEPESAEMIPDKDYINESENISETNEKRELTEEEEEEEILRILNDSK